MFYILLDINVLEMSLLYSTVKETPIAFDYGPTEIQLQFTDGNGGKFHICVTQEMIELFKNLPNILDCKVGIQECESICGDI